MASNEHITVAGLVTNLEALNSALVLAEPYAPKKIVNMMQVGGVQQVMMEVKISEMQRGLLKRLGVNFTRRQLGHRDFSIGRLNELSTTEADPLGAGGLSVIASTAATALLGFNVGNDAWTIVLDLLKEHGLSKQLAEPTLITESGQPASFLVGGEFPVPIPQTFNTLSIKYKEFGVGLKFTPTVLSNERISLVVNPEVSELNFADGIQLGGFQVPSLITRRVKTVVELGDGQSFAIAGMLQDNIRETIAKYPILGDIPILGALFRSTSFEKKETELIVIVTPHLVKPVDMVKQTLPTDHYLEPNDFELMLMGYLEGVYPESHVPRPSQAYQVGEPRMATRMPYRNGGIEGVFGHLAP
jgi:pilus assembly protein CpaC